MPELIVTCRELKYGRTTYLNGERFTASDKDAKLLKAVRKAADAPERKPVRQAATVQPRAIVAETPAEDETHQVQAMIDEAGPEGVDLSKPGRKYRTRRLSAED